MQPTRPNNFKITRVDGLYVLTWEASEDAQGYKVYLDTTLLTTTTELTYTLENEVSGQLKVVAYNGDLETESDIIPTTTVPNLPNNFKVSYSKVVDGYKFIATFKDNSSMEQGYKIKYTVDGGVEEVIDITTYTQEESVTQEFPVAEIINKIDIKGVSYNTSGENETSLIEMYTPPTYRWAYLKETHEILLAWENDLPLDSNYKIRYRVNGGSYQYATIPTTQLMAVGVELQHRIPLSETSYMDVAMCVSTTVDGIYTDNVRVGMAEDVNLIPPSGFASSWKSEGVATLQWGDIYDCDKSYELYYVINDGEEIKVDIPSTTTIPVGDIYTYDVNIPYGQMCKARVRMVYGLNHSEFATLDVPHLLNKPVNVQLSTVGIITTITWDIVDVATGYRVYIDGKEIANVNTNTATIERDLYGMVSVVAYNNFVSSPESDKVYIRTMPNPPLWLDIDAVETEMGRDITVGFTDNSLIESHYRVEYTVDDGATMSTNIDTENMPLPPNTALDEDKTYLMWSDIEKTDGKDIEMQGVANEVLKNVKVSGNTDTSGYYPMSIGTVDPLAVGVNEANTPIRFSNTTISQGEEKTVVDVARFQEINMVIEGNTIKKDGVAKSVTPYVHNKPNSIAHTIALDHVKGHSEVRGNRLINNQEYGLTLGNVGAAIDKVYRDKVVYATKQYDITATESFLVDGVKTNNLYTIITNVRLSDCIMYTDDQVFKAISNYFTPQSYADSTYGHLKCMYNNKLYLMFENKILGINAADSSTVKVNKCKAFLTGKEASIRYEIANPITQVVTNDFFVGDIFKLGSAGDVKDVIDTVKGEVVFRTEDVVENGKIVDRVALDTPFTEKIDVIQNTFIVDSTDGSDKEVNIQNLDFIEGKVVQEGFNKSYINVSKRIHAGLKCTDTTHVCFDGTYDGSKKMCQFVTLEWGAFLIGVDSAGGAYCRTFDNAYISMNLPNVKGCVSGSIIAKGIDVTFTIKANGEERTITQKTTKALSQNNALTLLDNGENNASVKCLFVYDKILTPSEIQHNLQVLNNSPSITGINADGKEYAFSTDSNHVVCDTGYNVEETIGGIYEACSTPFSGVNGKVEIGDAINKSKISLSENEK